MIPSNIERHARDASGVLGPNPRTSSSMISCICHPCASNTRCSRPSWLPRPVRWASCLPDNSWPVMDLPAARGEAIEAGARFERDVWGVSAAEATELSRRLDALESTPGGGPDHGRDGGETGPAGPFPFPLRPRPGRRRR